jgi:hypothetical protein
VTANEKRKGRRSNRRWEKQIVGIVIKYEKKQMARTVTGDRRNKWWKE